VKAAAREVLFWSGIAAGLALAGNMYWQMFQLI
jgi:hypothetical protein